jgi:DNA-binding NarL/FixJ family response regulator
VATSASGSSRAARTRNARKSRVERSAQWRSSTTNRRIVVSYALGERPLRAEIEALARRGRVALDDDDAGPPDPAAELGITAREREVLALLAEGRTNREIAETLVITEKTASVHVSHILAKLDARNRGEAAAIAHRRGLTSAHR